MKFLIGIISGIALAGAGVTVASSNPFDAAAATVTPEVAYAQPSVAHDADGCEAGAEAHG